MLTQKQERFVQELVKGKTQREAYKASYDASKMKDKTVDEKASRLFKQDKIRARYDELIKEAMPTKDAVSMRAFIIEKLEKIASGEICDETTEYDADGNVLRRRRVVKANDVHNAINKLAEYYGVQTQVDQKIVVRFEDETEDYGD